MSKSTRLYNERPSAVLNIGSDIPAAARHRNDTYETPEVARTKAFKKQSTVSLRELKATAISMLAEDNYLSILQNYEVSKFVKSCESLAAVELNQTGDADAKLATIKAYLLANRNTLVDFAKVADGFNRLSRKVRRLRWNVRSLADAVEYFAPKARESFVERNGVVSSWTPASPNLTPAQVEQLKLAVKGVQFGNSVPDSERVYCSANLLSSITSLSKVLTLDLSAMGFSYGARGNAKSVAYYQDSLKVLSFNRHVDGALLHELGHAVDYQLGLVSSSLPASIRSAYGDKLRANKVTNYNYYMGRKEIFARLFEQYISMLLGNESTSFMYSCYSDTVMPDLNAESIAWLADVLKPVMKEQV